MSTICLIRYIMYLSKSKVKCINVILYSRSKINCRTCKMQTSNAFLTEHSHNLTWEEYNTKFCQDCLMRDIKAQCNIDEALFYVRDHIDGRKMMLIKSILPDLRICIYKCPKLKPLPKNITCIYREHGLYCAYKKCLALCQHYISIK